MKRICTITHHTVPNYGAVLQTYALQKAIFSLGYDNEVLNYDEERVKRQYHYSLLSQRSLKEVIQHAIYHKRYKMRINVFQNFLHEYVQLSKRYTKANLSNANYDYDLFISGSDQVWSLGLHKGDTSYLLEFVKDHNKKGSYAASFGYENRKMIPEVYYPTYSKLLSQFRYVNVREGEGVTLFEDFTGKYGVANQVVDPTFLLSLSEWRKISKAPKERKYILLYCVNRYEKLYEYAKEISNITGDIIINIQDGGQVLSGVKNIQAISVNEFLGYIQSADYVLTNSFHGLAFSIIFNRQVIYDYVYTKVNSNVRIASLVRMLGLETRELSKVDIYSKIEYGEINNRLQKEVKVSYTKLKEMLD